MNGWVSSPVTLSERTLVVDEGTVAVILRDGKLYDVRGPGRHGGLWRLFTENNNLPLFGELKVMTFHRGPSMSDPISVPVRLVDRATVNVTVVVSIVPMWRTNPSAAGNTVREYGIDPRRIEEGEQVKLVSAVKAMIESTVGSQTHNYVHTYPDKRSLLSIPHVPGLLQVSGILSCEISRDDHLEAAIRDERDAALEAQRAYFSNRIEMIRLFGSMERQHAEAVSQAQLHLAVSRMLGVPVTDLAFPGSRELREGAQYRAAEAVLAQNLDLVPLFADPTAAHAVKNLMDAVNGMFGGPGMPTAAPPMLPSVAGGASARLVKRITMDSPSGAMEVLLVGGGEDRVIGQIGAPPPNRLLVIDNPDPVNVALRALGLAGTWCGLRIGAIPSSSGVDITRVEGEGANSGAETALGTWISGINQVLEGRSQIRHQIR